MTNIDNESLSQKDMDRLVNALDGEDPFGAIYALGKTGDERAVKPLSKMLQHQRFSCREAAAYWLGELGFTSSASALASAIADEDETVRHRATESLLKLGDVGKTLLLKKIKSEEKVIRYEASFCIAQLAEERVLPVLFEALDDEDARFRARAAFALGYIMHTDVVPALIEKLNDEDEFVRQYAAESLADHKDVRSIPALIEALNDEDKFPPRPPVLSHRIWPREWVIRALGSIQHEDAARALIEALGNPEASRRDLIIEELEKRKEKLAIPVLFQIAKDHNSDTDLREDALIALFELDTEKSIPVLIDLLGDDMINDMAIHMIVECEAHEAAPAIVELLQHSNVDIRQKAIHALGVFGAKNAVPALISCLSDHSVVSEHITWLSEINKPNSYYAAEALEKIGTAEALQAAKLWRERSESNNE